MNIILKLTDLFEAPEKMDTRVVYFLDTKKNMIMDGEFTKVLYVRPHVTMDGWFIECPLYINHITEKYSNLIWFQPYHQCNIHVLKHFSEIEKQLLDYYMDYKQCDKTPQYSLHNQLYSGNIKIYSYKMKSSESREELNSDAPRIKILSRPNSLTAINQIQNPVVDSNVYKCTIKISGVWESAKHVGLTYKFLQA